MDNKRSSTKSNKKSTSKTRKVKDSRNKGFGEKKESHVASMISEVSNVSFTPEQSIGIDEKKTKSRTAQIQENENSSELKTFASDLIQKYSRKRRTIARKDVETKDDVPKVKSPTKTKTIDLSDPPKSAGKMKQQDATPSEGMMIFN